MPAIVVEVIVAVVVVVLAVAVVDVVSNGTDVVGAALATESGTDVDVRMGVAWIRAADGVPMILGEAGRKSAW